MFEDEKKPEPKPVEKDALDEYTNLQQDKIFNNTYETAGFDSGKMSFNLSPQFGKSNNFEDTIEQDMAWELVSKLLDTSKFKDLNKPDKEGNYKKLNKLQINEVYSYIVMQIPDFSRIQIFSVVQEYFDVNSNKFYDSLSNTFKKELIEELRTIGYMREKTGGPLF
jgi:hypothetical protein